MKSRNLTAAEATSLVKEKWVTTFPNDEFVRQLIQFEEELRGKGAQ